MFVGLIFVVSSSLEKLIMHLPGIFVGTGYLFLLFKVVVKIIHQINPSQILINLQ